MSLIGLPYQFGRRDDGRGYRMAHGPEVLLAPDAVPARFRDAFDDVTVEMLDDLDDAHPAADGNYPYVPGDQMVRQLIQNQGLAAAVGAATRAGRFPVVAAGACNSAIGVVSGLDDADLGMFWFDAHGDAETPETSADGLFEGMPVSVIAGQCWRTWRESIAGFHVVPEDRIVQVGLHDRSFARSPEEVPRALGTQLGPADLGREVFRERFDEVLESKRSSMRRVYVHIDTDIIDADVMRSSRHAAPGGLHPDQLVWAVSRIATVFEIRAVNFTCYDTSVDPGAPDILTPLMLDVATAAAGVPAGAGR